MRFWISSSIVFIVSMRSLYTALLVDDSMSKILTDLLHYMQNVLLSLTMKLVIFDIDGVLLRGLQALPHAADSVKKLREHCVVVSFLTNNSSSAPEVYAQRLINASIDANPDEIMTSAIATVLYLRKLSPEGARILVVGEEGITSAMSDAGFTIIDYDNPSSVDYVVVGMDRGFNYEKLARAQSEIWFNKAILIGTNNDPIYPIENGGIRPGGGTMIAALEACTRQKALIIGKPETITIDLILEKYKVEKDEAMIVGDNLDTDILAGKRAGIATAFVLTGIHTENDLRNAPSDRIPDFILRNLSTLDQCLNI